MCFIIYNIFFYKTILLFLFSIEIKWFILYLTIILLKMAFNSTILRCKMLSNFKVRCGGHLPILQTRYHRVTGVLQWWVSKAIRFAVEKKNEKYVDVWAGRTGLLSSSHFPGTSWLVRSLRLVEITKNFANISVIYRIDLKLVNKKKLKRNVYIERETFWYL